MNRSPMPGQYGNNPEMAQEISENPTFSSLASELLHEREVQAMRWQYVYNLSGSIAGQTSQVFNITIEQGTDFLCKWLTGSTFSYDAQNASAFPIPNSEGVTAWAGRGLSVKITDSNSGRELTSGFVPMELLCSPGYGLNFQYPFPLRYLFGRNNKVKFDIRNRDAATRTHYFEIALIGFKYATPN